MARRGHVLDLEAEVEDPIAATVLRGGENSEVDVPVGEDDRTRLRRAGPSPHLAHPERVLVELRQLPGVLRADRDVPNLRHWICFLSAARRTVYRRRGSVKWFVACPQQCRLRAQHRPAVGSWSTGPA